MADGAHDGWKLSEEEEKQILAMAPRGTWALLLTFMVLAFLSWLYLFFGVFLEHGPVS